MFHMSLLEQDITKKGQIDENMMELKAGNTEEYEVEAIWNNTVYAIESNGHLPGVYYLVSCKG